jgi:hypothetical protein
VVRIATEYRDGLRAKRPLEDKLVSMIFEISKKNYPTEVGDNDVVTFMCVSLTGVKLELSLQAALTLIDVNQPANYSVRVPGLIPLPSLVE